MFNNKKIKEVKSPKKEDEQLQWQKSVIREEYINLKGQ